MFSNLAMISLAYDQQTESKRDHAWERRFTELERASVELKYRYTGVLSRSLNGHATRYLFCSGLCVADGNKLATASLRFRSVCKEHLGKVLND